MPLPPMTHRSDPTGLHGAPALVPGSFYDLQQAAPVRFHDPCPPAPAPPPKALPPLLRVRPDARRGTTAVVLTKALLLAIPHLKAGAPIELVPPVRRGGPWHLDTRATAPRRIQCAAVARFSTAPLSREHYLVPAAPLPGVKGGAGGTSYVRERLAFVLGAEVSGHPGYFVLVPVA